MAVAQGAAVGGGSLIYANISIEATPDTFEAGWPPEVTYQELAPHYAAVGRMMNVQPVPRGQWPARTSLMHEAATATGQADRFRPLELAVNFDPGWDPGRRSAGYDPARSRRFTNAEGIEQGTCVHLGECDIGCPVLARNTLDLNYLPRAEHHGAEVRPLHVVRAIEREGDRYRVRSDRIEAGRLVPRDRFGAHRRPRRGLARARPTCCSAAATWRRRCRTCPPRSATAGAATATS